jgi:hypothetical protein
LVRYRAGRLSVEIEGRRQRSVGAAVCLKIADLLLRGADGIGAAMKRLARMNSVHFKEG